MTPALLAFALVLGAARAAGPGPANAEAVIRGRSGGARPVVLVHAGALAGELGWAMLAFAGLAMMLSDPGLRAALAIAGAVLLAGTGLGALRAVATDTGEPAIDPAIRPPGRGPFAMGVGFSGTRVLSPVLWLGIGAWLSPLLPLGSELAGSALFLGAVAAGWLAWAAVLGGLLARAPDRVTGGPLRLVDGVAGVAMLGLVAVVLAGRLTAP